MRYTEHDVTEEDIAAVTDVLRSRSLTQGPTVEQFEWVLAEYVGAQHAVAVSSGTAALHLAYLAADAKSVITSPLSFVATANAAVLAGASVGFGDVDAATGNLDLHQCPPIGSIIVPVHYAGRAAQIPSLTGFGGPARVIEDACHALGAMDYDGCSRVGSCAHSLATVFSFHPAKHITTGEGGAVTTNDADLAARVRLLRSHGRVDGQMVALGWNYRMSDVNAALGLSQLRRIDENVARRRWLVGRYYAAMEVVGAVLVPFSTSHAWHLLTVRIKDGRRDEVKAQLAERGIHAQVHYSPIIPLQPYYRERYGYKPGRLPNAEAWAAEELSLPLYPTMTDADVGRVVDALKES